jgi:hypothetical protein
MQRPLPNGMHNGVPNKANKAGLIQLRISLLFSLPFLIFSPKTHPLLWRGVQIFLKICLVAGYQWEYTTRIGYPIFAYRVTPFP